MILSIGLPSPCVDLLDKFFVVIAPSVGIVTLATYGCMLVVSRPVL